MCYIQFLYRLKNIRKKFIKELFLLTFLLIFVDLFYNNSEKNRLLDGIVEFTYGSSTGSSGDSDDTRPKNMALLACIRYK